MSEKKTQANRPPKSKKADHRTRVQKIRQAQTEEVRRKFKAIEYIRQLEESAKEYDRIRDEMKKAVTRRGKLTTKEREQLVIIRSQISILKAQLEAVKQKVDLNLRRLRYCVPELKAIELSDPTGSNPFLTFAAAMKEALEDDIDSSQQEDGEDDGS